MQYPGRSGRFFLFMLFLAIDHLCDAQDAFDSGRFAEARTKLESGPPSGASAALLARIYLQLKPPQRAAAARQAEQLAPSNPTVQHSLALYFAVTQQRKLAALWEGRYAQSPKADSATPSARLSSSTKLQTTDKPSPSGAKAWSAAIAPNSACFSPGPTKPSPNPMKPSPNTKRCCSSLTTSPPTPHSVSRSFGWPDSTTPQRS